MKKNNITVFSLTAAAATVFAFGACERNETDTGMDDAGTDRTEGIDFPETSPSPGTDVGDDLGTTGAASPTMDSPGVGASPTAPGSTGTGVDASPSPGGTGTMD